MGYSINGEIMIKETLISFEVAKLAKQKGFDCIGNNYYGLKGVEHFNHPLNFSNSECDNIYLAVTQSLLQKWIREQFNLSIEVYASVSGWQWQRNKGCKDVTGGTYIEDSNYRGSNDAGAWDTYEEALEHGLLMALAQC